MDAIIIIDDANPTGASLPEQIKIRIETFLRRGSVRVEGLLGVQIAHSFADAKLLARNIQTGGDNVVGFLVDLVDGHDLNAGATLTTLLRGDPLFGSRKIVIYTDKHIEISVPGLLAVGADAVVLRDVQPRIDNLCNEILAAFRV